MSEKEILISVIIPCYNVEFYVDKSIESVLAQTFSSWEMICINDGSVDQTSKKIRAYVDKYPDKIKLIEQENGGAPLARNKGFKIAKGSYIQFLDADDWLLPDKLENQYRLAHSREEPADLVIGTFINRGKKEYIVFPYEKDPWVAFMRSGLGVTSANLYKRGLIEEVGGWREDLKSTQDYNLIFSCLKANSSITYDLLPLTLRIIDRPGEIWEDNRFRPSIFINELDLQTRAKQYLQENNLWTNVRKEASEAKIEYILNNILFNNLYPDNAQNLIQKSVQWTGFYYPEKIQKQVEEIFQSILENSPSSSEKISRIKGKAVSFIIPYLDSNEKKVRGIAIELILRAKIYTLEQLSQLEGYFTQEQDIKIKKNIEKAMEESLIEFWAKEPPLEEMEKGKYLQVHLFLEKEALDIREILEENGILFYEKVTQKGHPQLPNHHKFYAFFVPVYLYSQTIDLIQEYLGWKISECPACQTSLEHAENSEYCPECEIFLGQIKVNKHHPFANLLNTLNLINLDD